jgi:hypothetical protein
VTIANQKQTARTPERDEPVYWFVVLEQAMSKGELQTAAVAQRELNRLGVTVKYQRKRQEVARGN